MPRCPPHCGFAVSPLPAHGSGGQKTLDAVLKGGEKAGAWLGRSDAPNLEQGEAVRAEGAVFRQLQSWLKEKEPSFGGLVRVQNKRQEFLWVHPQFEKEY